MFKNIGSLKFLPDFVPIYQGCFLCDFLTILIFVLKKSTNIEIIMEI